MEEVKKVITIKVIQNECERCKHKWNQRKLNKPIVCPKCKTPYWYMQRYFGLKPKTTIKKPDEVQETEIEKSINEMLWRGKQE